MSTPSRFIDYPFAFRAERRGLKWAVVSRDTFQRLDRDVIRVWSQTTALRIADALTQWHRTGWDCGASGKALYGGGRFA